MLADRPLPARRPLRDAQGTVHRQGKHGEKKGGDVDKLTEQEIDDLVEFVLSL